jgi:hypothetical protein
VTRLAQLDPYAVIGSILALVALGVAARLHGIYLRDPSPIGFDDGYTRAIGERLIEGQWLPYVDGCSHRGPMLYWAAAVAQKLTGRFGWVGTRWLTIVTTLATLLGVFAAGLAARRPFAGGVAALVYAWTSLVSFDSGFKVTGEGVAVPFGVAAVLFTCLGLFRAERPRWRHAWMFAAGAGAALAGLGKQTALPTIGPIALWVLADAWSRAEWSRRQRWQMLGALGAGFLFPLVVVVLRYAASGALGTFWYWYYGYNAEVYMHPFKDVGFLREFNNFLRREPWPIGAMLIAMAWGLARAVAQMERGLRGIARGYARAGFEATAAWLALMMFAAAVAPMRNWAHYFITVFPFMALLVGAQGEVLLGGQGSPRFRVAAHAVAGAILLAWFGQVSAVRIIDLEFQRPPGGAVAMTPEPLCQLIDRHSTARDGVFIWGFDGDLYLTCRRRPSTRFTYLTLVAGTVPPAWSDIREDRVARGAREQLLDDLKKDRPPVILDMPGNMGHVSILHIAPLRRFLEVAYCPQPDALSKSGRRASVWVRRDLPACRR